MYDVTTHLLFAQDEHRERQRQAAEYALASRIVRLRRLDHRAKIAATRARLVRLALQ